DTGRATEGERSGHHGADRPQGHSANCVLNHSRDSNSSGRGWIIISLPTMPPLALAPVRRSAARILALLTGDGGEQEHRVLKRQHRVALVREDPQLPLAELTLRLVLQLHA